MVTTLSPCWYCSGLVRQFRIGLVVVGESRNFVGGHDWLVELGHGVLELDDPECIELLGSFIAEHPSSGTKTSDSEAALAVPATRDLAGRDGSECGRWAGGGRRDGRRRHRARDDVALLVQQRVEPAQVTRTLGWA